MHYSILSFLFAWMFPTKDDRTEFRSFCRNIDLRQERSLIKDRQIKLVKKIKVEAARRKLKVVFLNSQNSKWVYQSLYEEFEKNPHFEVQVLITVGDKMMKKKNAFLNYKKIALDNYNFFASKNMNVAYAFDFDKKQYIDLNTFKQDLIFYEQPWRLNKHHNVLATSKYALPFYCSYGSNITNGTNEYSETLYGDVYTYFLDNNFTKKFLKSHNLDENRLSVAGQLKLDAYLKPIDKTKILWKTNKKRIIYAPHHSFSDDSILRFGTFDKNYKFFYNYAKSHLEFEFILKPHPELKKNIIKEKLMSIEEMTQYFRMWEELPNAQIYEFGCYFDIFRTSDLLITDCNSFLFEYLPTNKPVIHLINDKSVGHNEYGQKIISGYYSAKNIDEINQLIEQLLVKEYDPLKEVRTNVIEKDLIRPNGGVSKYIVRHIEEICGIKG